MKQFLIILFLLCSVNSYAGNVDSVKIWKQSAVSATTDSDKLFWYSKLITASFEKDKVESFNYLLDAFCESHSLMTSYWNTSINNYVVLFRGEFNEISDSILLSRIKTHSDGQTDRCYAILCYLYSNSVSLRGNMDVAFSYLYRASGIFEKLNDNDALVKLKFSEAYYYLRMENFEKGKLIVDKIDPLEYPKIEKLIEFEKNYFIAAYMGNQGKYDSAYLHHIAARTLSPSYMQLAIVEAQLGEDEVGRKNFIQAIQHLQRALVMVDSIGDHRNSGIWLGSIGEALIQMGKYSGAIDTFRKALAIQEKLRNSWDVARTCEFLATAYSLNRDFEKAYHYRLVTDSIKEVLNSAKIQQAIGDLQTEHAIEKKDQEIDEQKNQLKKQKIINYGIAGIACLLLILFFTLHRNYIQKKRTNFALENARQKSESLRLKAEQSEKFKQQFLANMSHEIRTPMNAVMGMTNLLLEKNPRGDQVNYLGGIKKSSDTLLHIINDILDLSKIAAGKIELEKIDFSVREVVDQVSQILKFKADEKGLQLITHIDDSIPEVLIGDPVRLNQVLMNLGGNAIKFTEQGSVTIAVRPIPTFPEGEGAANAREPVLSPSGRVRVGLSITDTGTGIPKEKLSSIFESFTQAYSSDSRRYGGTGLGLTISKQLVELMGGNLKVESKPGSGSTFSFALQMEVGSAEKIHQQQNSEREIDGSILDGLRILLADDNEYNCVVAIDTLKSKAEVEIDEATNGREAIELLKQKDFDVVLMDVQMPELDGYEATRKIRTEFSSPKNQIPIIALTASVIRADLDKCKAAGMNDYVPKPFKVSQLINAIAEATGRSSPSKSPQRGDLASRESPLPPVEGAVGGIDLTYLRNFCEGDEMRMKKYISMFLDSIPPFQRKIEKAISENDFAEIARQVHTMKPKFVMMGMKAAQRLSVEIESEGREQINDYFYSDKVRQLNKLITQAVDELKS